MKQIIALALGLAAISVPVFSQSPDNIVRDYQNDVEGDPDRPLRVRLKSQTGLKLGRMAGVWGTVGGSDQADSFFLGTTPDKARMQFDLTVLPDGGAVKVIVTAEDGENTERHEINAAAGENTKSWLRLKGNITAQAVSDDPNSVTYALYFWYPGDTIDALATKEFEDVKASKGREKPRMLRAVKGGGS